MKMEDSVEICMRNVCYQLVTTYCGKKPRTIEIRAGHGFIGAPHPHALEERTREYHDRVVGQLPLRPHLKIITCFSFIGDGIEYSTKIVMRDEHA